MRRGPPPEARQRGEHQGLLPFRSRSKIDSPVWSAKRGTRRLVGVGRARAACPRQAIDVAPPSPSRSSPERQILADATNLGLGRMAESSRGLTLSRLRWTAEWHVRDETYLSALAAIVDCHTAHPLAQVWGPGDTSSSDGQFFRAGGQGEARADRNARYGSEPGVLFYTHVTDRFTPFHTKVIAANAGEAAHVLDGLLDHESELVIREHATDTAGAVDHVFGLCHLLGFRFAPRIRDLNERRLYSLSSLDPWPTLRQLVAGPVNVRAIEEDWDETLRLAASIRAGTVSASVMLRKLAGFPRQNPVARALREIGRIERTLFMLDWFDDPEQRRRTGSILNKGEARNALARAAAIAGSPAISVSARTPSLRSSGVPRRTPLASLRWRQKSDRRQGQKSPISGRVDISTTRG